MNISEKCVYIAVEFELQPSVRFSKTHTYTYGAFKENKKLKQKLQAFAASVEKKKQFC